MLAFLYCFVLTSWLLPGSDAEFLQSKPSTPSFEAFIQTHSKDYKSGSAEYQARRELYEKRAAAVELQNQQPKRLWTAGINQLSDWTDAELKQLRGWKGAASSGQGKTIGTVGKHLNLRQTQNRKLKELPENKSWEHLTSSKHVRDQGSCGSCWAVTAATVLDAHSEIYSGGSSMQYSAQDFVSCVPNKEHCGGDGGCDGSTVELAYDWAMFNGISSEQKVPYKATDGSCANTHASGKLIYLAGVEKKELDPPLSHEELLTPGVHWATSPHMPGLAVGLHGWERLPENEYEPLMHALVELGPVAVSVAADEWSDYSEGVFNSCSLDAVIDHAVTLIGYGKDVDANVGYWLIQNSWGPFWGENGHIRLLREDNEREKCGTDSQPEVGTGCDGGPKEVRVCGMCGILYDTVVPHFRSQNQTVALAF